MTMVRPATSWRCGRSSSAGCGSSSLRRRRRPRRRGTCGRGWARSPPGSPTAHDQGCRRAQPPGRWRSGWRRSASSPSSLTRCPRLPAGGSPRRTGSRRTGPRCSRSTPYAGAPVAGVALPLRQRGPPRRPGRRVTGLAARLRRPEDGCRTRPETSRSRTCSPRARRGRCVPGRAPRLASRPGLAPLPSPSRPAMASPEAVAGTWAEDDASVPRIGPGPPGAGPARRRRRRTGGRWCSTGRPTGGDFAAPALAARARRDR